MAQPRPHSNRAAPALLCTIALAAVAAVGWTTPAQAHDAGQPPAASVYGSSLFAVNIDPNNEAAWQQSQPWTLTGTAKSAGEVSRLVEAVGV